MIGFQFAIMLEWREVRATYHNLKTNSHNALRDDEMSELWIPYIIFDNTDAKDAVKLSAEVYTTMVVTREGNFTRSPLTEVN